VIVILSSNYKIPDGKLVKIKLWVDAGKVTRITILGDFFLHPEEVIVTIESSLVGTDIKASSLLETITDVLEKTGATLIGASAKDLVDAIMMAWESK
jgi:hypothetical protein